MCKAKSDGGKRCPVHRHDSIAVVKIATEQSGLTKAQTEDLFVQLRREGRTTAAPDAAAWQAHLKTIETEAKTSENATDLKARIAKAREHSPVPDGGTIYAHRLLVERAKERATNLSTKLRAIADENGMTIADVREKFNTYYKAVDRRRGAAVPEEFTQMAVRRARQADIPHDRSTVVALAKTAAASVRGPRRIERQQVSSTFLSEYGYDSDGGRLEIVFRNNPDTVFAYRNVPESVWDRMQTGSAGSIYAREIRGNSDYTYATAEESEKDAYQVRCASCGQFRASSHVCPQHEERENLAEQGLNVEQIAEATRENGADTTVEPAEEEVAARTAAAVEAQAAEEQAAAAVEEEPAAPAEPVATYPTLTIDTYGEAPVDEYVPTADAQRHPTRVSISETHDIVKEVDFKSLEMVSSSNYTYRLPERYGKALSDEDMEKIKNSPANIFYVIGHNMDPEQQFKIVDVYDDTQYAGRITRNGSWYRRSQAEPMTSEFKLTRLGRKTPVKVLTEEERDELAKADTTRMEEAIANGSAVAVDSTSTLSRKFKVDGNLNTQHRVSFAKAPAFRRAINDGKEVVTSVVLAFEGQGSKIDDQGYTVTSSQGANVSGEMSFKKNSDGVMVVTSSEHKLRCNCYNYRRNYYCEHINYTQRHMANVAQQTMPAERTHRLLNAALAGRQDTSVVENDKKYGTFISFGDSVSFTGPGAGNNRWYPSHFVTVPAGTLSGSSDGLTEQDIQNVSAVRELASHISRVAAPENTTHIRQALRRADVSIPVGIKFGRTRRGEPTDGFRNEVTGSMVLHRNDDDTVTVRGHNLKCECQDYRENYDCEHVRFAAGQPYLFLNVNARRSDVPASMQDFYQNNYAAIRREESIQHQMRRNGETREEVVARIAREEAERAERDRRWREENAERIARAERERAERDRVEYERIAAANASLIEDHKTYRAAMLKRWEVTDASYAENPAEFHKEYEAALERKKNGEEAVPFQLAPVTDGICGDGPGARKFGVELEFDIKRGVDKRAALRKIGQELHEAGFTSSPSQGYYHSGASSNWAKWSFEQDCTVDAELVSPIMSDTPENWAEMQKVIEIVKRNGGTVSTRCGSHVHVSTSSYGMSTAKHAELLRTVNQNEDVLYRLASDPARGKHRGTKWCAPNVNDNSPDIDEDQNQGHSVLRGVQGHGLALNFEAAAQRQFMKSNVEFRTWDGTLDAGVIQQQIKVSAALTDYAERSVILNKGSKKPTEARKTIGHGRALEETALSKAGTRKHTAESFAESSKHVGEFLDKLFRKNEDKAGVAALFAVTNWQKK